MHLGAEEARVHDRSAGEQLVDELGRFARLFLRMRALVHRDANGTDQSALALLVPLRQEGPMRVRDLAEIKQADPSTVSRQAAQLVQAGLVRREADPTDGRAYRLVLTPHGEAVCHRLQAARREFVEAALHDWPADRVALFSELLHRFNDSVERHQRDHPPPTVTIADRPAHHQEYT